METAPAPTPAPHVLVVPFPAQGHVLPLLDLAAPLAARGLRLTVVTTPANLPLLSPLLDAHPAAVRALTLPFPYHPSLPQGLESTKGCGPGYFPVFIHAFAALRGPILAWARSQSDPVVAVIADFFCGWAQPLAADLGVAGIVFSPSGIVGTAVPHSLFRRLVRRPAESDDEFSVVTFPAIPGMPAYQWRELSMTYRNYMEGGLEEQVRESVRQNFLWNLESWGFVSNTVRALEGRYLDTPLEDLGFRRVWAVGPVAPETDAAGARGGEAAVAAANLSAWLDAFAEGSVVYVCFGSQAVLTPAVAAALAEALERSAVPFVWVVGTGSGGVIPEGFEERAAAARRGMVVRGWAPQVAALRHAAMGWFMTHCGWNSVLEAATAGVPMLAWPMTADQFVNARLLVDEARVAVRACAGGVGVAPDAGELAAVLADAVGEKGRGVRACAKELAAEAARAVKEGGSSYADLEGLVQEIRRLR
ncbi:flavonol 3-O-glucosyltransferase UGT89B1-like [Phragmites australis]|uniref:flavonol 3-O-glucosyltransferase UGT89B1-like n=1 Tax=Phragmites australis TaxID=29695 RepID=UPI002D765715|nr:flavonol 3-O-glucosyltransferase UGT89B1-like [Phragmites australis]